MCGSLVSPGLSDTSAASDAEYDMLQTPEVFWNARVPRKPPNCLIHSEVVVSRNPVFKQINKNTD